MPEGSARCILLSGGIDSALVCDLLGEGDGSSVALFVDYGQPALSAEKAASSAIAAHYGLSWFQVTVGDLTLPADGEIAARNDMLIALACASTPGANVAIGTHSGSGYPDCSPEHHLAWQRVLDVQRGGSQRLLAPLISLDKATIVAMARTRGVPLHLTYSCESGSTPCGSCSSCRDKVAHLGSA